jgi:hypothetical protein
LFTLEQESRTILSIKSGLHEWVSRMKPVQLFASCRSWPKPSRMERFFIDNVMSERSRSLYDYNLSPSTGRRFMLSSLQFDIGLTK